jgi:hypothetical protein
MFKSLCYPKDLGCLQLGVTSKARATGMRLPRFWACNTWQRFLHSCNSLVAGSHIMSKLLIKNVQTILICKLDVLYQTREPSTTDSAHVILILLTEIDLSIILIP